MAYNKPRKVLIWSPEGPHI